MTSDDLKIARRQLIAIGVSVFTLGASIAGFAQAAHPGDTPVVLIGGTVTVKVGSTNPRQKWGGSGRNYHTKSKFKIASIALKNDASDDQDDKHRDDDDKPDTDMQCIDVSGATSWKVDVYAQPSDLQPIISITSGSDIQLAVVNSGALCKDTNRRKAYSPDPGCTALGKQNAVFAKAVVTVNGTVPTRMCSNSSAPTGTLTCTNSSPGPGRPKCRIVFRYPSVP